MRPDSERESREIDDLVRAASDRATDETQTCFKVLARIDAEPAAPRWYLPAIGPQMATAGFAALMLAAGVAGYQLPEIASGSTEQDILLMAFGLPDSVAGPLDGLIARGAE